MASLGSRAKQAFLEQSAEFAKKKKDILIVGNADILVKQTAADFPPVGETMVALDQTFGVRID